MSLGTPPSVQKLQTALHEKAKGSPDFRFYALYDKVHREDVLAFAYDCCKANSGAAGVDGQAFEDIEEYVVKRWLDKLARELNAAPSSFHCPHPQAQILKRRDSHRFQLGRLSADVIHSVGDQQTGQEPRGTSKLLFLSEPASVK